MYAKTTIHVVFILTFFTHAVYINNPIFFYANSSFFTLILKKNI